MRKKDIIYWETNSKVEQNTNISESQKIAKCKTIDFPEGVTVRTNNMKEGVITAYFYGKIQHRYYEDHKWHYPESKLIVDFPSKNSGYIFNGEIPCNMSLTEVSEILDHIKCEAKKMYGKSSGKRY